MTYTLNKNLPLGTSVCTTVFFYSGKVIVYKERDTASVTPGPT